MVKATHPWLVAVLFFAAPLLAKEVADYKIGDHAEEDITAPTSLVVIDSQATAELKSKEGERVPVIFRFYPQAAGEAAAAFHQSFVQTRGNFLDAVEENFDSRKLEADTLASAKFSKLVVSFQKKNPLFPVTTDLARLWAQGESDEPFETPLLSSLAAEMKLYIRATNSIPEGAKVGATVRMVSYADTETLTALMVARHGTNYPKTDFISYPRAKADLLENFPPEQHAAAKYLSSFVRPNCVVESELTIVMRNKRTEGLSVTENFVPGQIIAKRGQPIDQKIFGVLTALREKTAASLQPPAMISVPPPAKNNRWFIVSAAGVIFLAIVSVAIWRRKKAVSKLPALIEGAQGSSRQDWRRRAIAAEHRAEKAHKVIREGLVAQLAHWMSDKLVQKLLWQRSHLIETQQKAAGEMDRLGQRLDTIHSRMHDRLAVYERRIVELEKELDTKDEINRELIQSEIHRIRRQMEVERVAGEGGLN